MIVNPKARLNDRPWTDTYSYAVLIVTWILAAILVNPIGDFPLNDDWAYSRGVESLVNSGALVLDTWPAMTLIAQIGLGAAWTKVFGFSFTALRLLTLVVAVLGQVLVYGNFRLVTTPKVSCFGTLVLCFTPLYFVSAFSFMTEVYFLTAIAGGSLYFGKYLHSPAWWKLLVAGLFCIFATLIRQPGVILPFAFGLVGTVFAPDWRRRILLWLPFVASYLALQGYFEILATHYPEITKVDGSKALFAGLLNKGWGSIQDSASSLILYAALFSLPISVVAFAAIWTGWTRKTLAYMAVSVTAGFYLLNQSGILSTTTVGNLFFNLGLGPRLLKSNMAGVNSVGAVLPEVVYLAIRYVAAIGAALLVYVGLRRCQNYVWFEVSKPTASHRSSLSIQWETNLRLTYKLGLAAYATGYLIATSLASSFFDRYSLPIIQIVLLLLVPKNLVVNRIALYFGALLLVLNATFSTLATHDYLAYHRARSEAYHELHVTKQIPPSKIDGGFEWNGWYNDGTSEGVREVGRSWWWVDDDDYIITQQTLSGYSVVNQYPFQTYLPGTSNPILTLSRNNSLAQPDRRIRAESSLDSVMADGQSFVSSDPRVKFNVVGKRTQAMARTGRYSVRVDSTQPYGPGIHIQNPKPGDRIEFSLWKYPPGQPLNIVIQSADQELYYEGQNRYMASDARGWEKIAAWFIVPEYTGDDRLHIYTWHNSNRVVWIDDLELSIE